MDSATRSSGAAARTFIPVRVEATCAGDPYEIGFQQGRALRDKLRRVPALLRQLEAFRLHQPGWMPFPVYRWLAVRKAAKLLREPLQLRHAEMLRRLEGISAGSGLHLPVLMLCNALEPLLASVRGRYVMPPLGGCSVIAVRGARSLTGEPLISRNFDYLPMLQPLYALRSTRPNGGFQSLDFIAAPLAGAVDGMNEHGLSITYDYAFVIDQPPSPATPISMTISLALERCKTVAEAADLICTQPRWGGGLLMMADATGDIAAVEISNTRAEVRRPGPGEDILFHTNAFCLPSMRVVQVPDDAVFTDQVPTPLRNVRVLESSSTRQARYRELLARQPQFGLDELTSVMSDHGPTNEPSHLTPCVHSSYWFTTAVLQFLPCARRMRVDFASACQARFQEFVVGETREVNDQPGSPSSPSVQ